MSELSKFVSEHEGVVVLAMFLSFAAIIGTLIAIYCALHGRIQHQNIAKAGWPPAHLDASGDFKPDPEVDEDED